MQRARPTEQPLSGHPPISAPRRGRDRELRQRRTGWRPTRDMGSRPHRRDECPGRHSLGSRRVNALGHFTAGRRLRRGTLALALLGLALILTLAQGAAAAERPRVLAVEFAASVNPVTKDFLIGEIERAERDGYAAVVLLTDTPGGLDASMRDVIKTQLAADVPVVLYVYPPGARAASAGVFLAMAADVAAMAPQTNIGSSTPVSVSGEEIPEDVRRKVVNDAAAYIRALADEHGRNGDWAESAVREGANLPARAALERNVVDVVAPDLHTLLERIDGMKTQPKGLVLRTAGAQVE